MGKAVAEYGTIEKKFQFMQNVLYIFQRVLYVYVSKRLTSLKMKKPVFKPGTYN